MSPTATSDGANVPNKSSGVCRFKDTGTNETELPDSAAAVKKHVHVTAYVSEKNFSMEFPRR